MATQDESFPEELQERLSAFDDSLSNFEEIVKSLHESPLSQVQADMKPLDKAKLELVGVYALNSLYWMYLNARGENPKEHSVRQELDRVKSYMKRVKEIEDKAKAPKVDKDASKRFVRSALWQQAQKKKKNKSTESKEAETEESQPKKTKLTESRPKSSRGRYHFQKPERKNDRKFTV